MRQDPSTSLVVEDKKNIFLFNDRGLIRVNNIRTLRFYAMVLQRGNHTVALIILSFLSLYYFSDYTLLQFFNKTMIFQENIISELNYTYVNFQEGMLLK